MQTKSFNIYNNTNPAVIDAYSLLASNIHVIGKDALKTIVLTSCRPGEGKTSLAIDLSLMMAQSGRKTLLIDADIRKPTQAKRLTGEISIGLTDYLAGDVELKDALSNTNVENLYYMSCGKNAHNPISLFFSTRFEEMVSSVREQYDFVFFDSSALSSVADSGLIASKVDGVLIVVEMGVTSLDSLKRVKEQLDNMNANVLGAVLNKVPKSEYKVYFESYNYFFNNMMFLNKSNKKKGNVRVKQSVKNI